MVHKHYIKHKTIKGAMGIKIAADNCARVCAGTSLMRLEEEDYAEHIKAEVMQDLNKVENLLQKSGRGVFVTLHLSGCCLDQGGRSCGSMEFR